MIGFGAHSKDALDMKFIYCLAQQEELRGFHKAGERMFLFKDERVSEIWITRTDNPEPIITKAFPYKLDLDYVRFENHTLSRKSLILLAPTGMILECEVFDDGLVTLNKKIQMIMKRYKEEAKKNKL